MVKVGGSKPPVVPATIGLPGRWYVVKAEVRVETGAQGAGEVVVTATVRGDTIAVVYVDNAGEFLDEVWEALSNSSPFPSECRLVPFARTPDEELAIVRVQRPGRTATRGRVDVRPLDGGGLALEVRLGLELAEHLPRRGPARGRPAAEGTRQRRA